MRFPKEIKHRGQTATIYGKSNDYGYYRVVWRVHGKRQMKSFGTYSAALKHAETMVREVASGSTVTALTPGQASDALAAFERLQGFYKHTGRRLSLLEVVSGYCDAATKLNGSHTVGEAIERFVNSVALVKRKALGEGVAEYIGERKPESVPKKHGMRPALSPVYFYNVAMWLNEFAKTFPGHCVCDLTKEHLDTYLKAHSRLSAKSRNDRRAVVKMFLRWCSAKDYLAQNHRLFEAPYFNKTEDASPEEIDFYRPAELRAMLDNADADLVPVIALGGLGGLRREEILRLEWSDVWRVKDNVEIGARIAKGRKRRLVGICPALAAWLKPYRNATGPVWGKSPDALEEALAGLRDTLKIPARRNGLRHAFITFHMAMHSNENLTAAECGNSPAMLHEHYRALSTRKEALKWFAVKPAKARAANVIAL